MYFVVVNFLKSAQHSADLHSFHFNTVCKKNLMLLFELGRIIFYPCRTTDVNGCKYKNEGDQAGIEPRKNKIPDNGEEFQRKDGLSGKL